MGCNEPKKFDLLQASVVVDLEICKAKVTDIFAMLIPYDDRHFY